MPVVEDARALGDVGLLEIGTRHPALVPELTKALLQPFDERLVAPHRAPEERGDGRFREIVRRRPEPARRDHRARAVERLPDGIGDVLPFVSAGAASRDGDAHLGEAAREVRAIGVDGEAEEDLGADRDELDAHADWQGRSGGGVVGVGAAVAQREQREPAGYGRAAMAPPNFRRYTPSDHSVSPTAMYMLRLATTPLSIAKPFHHGERQP